jgi:ADP-heptose:LPS heptosyltransferase
LSGVDLLLSNDSGPMHLAAGLGTPVVSVFTCTSPVRSGPPGPQHALVATELPCAASYKKVCPHAGSGHMACFEELSVERVWRALARIVEADRAQIKSA